MRVKVSGRERPLYTNDMIGANLATKSNVGTAMQILAGNRNLTSSFGFNETDRVALRTTEIGVSRMKSNSGISVSQTSMSRTSWLQSSWMGIVVLMLALPLPALAALGGDVSSVHEDQAQMKGALKTTETEAYTTHEITAPGKTVVKEYVSPAGKVFAITWQGEFIPNMKQLLGTYFDQFAQTAKAQRENHLGHRPVSIQQPGFVFQNGGHMRAYVGRAYVPALVPQGVNVDALQ
ncbi:MAG: DUF2844 domain-containing protein [Terriglobales bacterium]